MPHKISRSQYEELKLEGFCWTGKSVPCADRLLKGEGTDADLQEAVDYCTRHGRNALARELLQPPD